MKKIPFVFLLFFATSCLKRNEINVNAVCVDSCITFNVRVSTGINSATPVSNSLIELGWSRPATPLGDPGRLIATGRTTSDGIVSFTFKALPKEIQNGQFYVRFNENNEYFLQQNSYYGITKYDSVVNADLHTPSKATLKIRFKNFMPASQTDYFQCLPQISTYGSTAIGLRMNKPNGQLSNTNFLASEGPFSLVELTGTTAGNQYTYFSIIKKKNGIRVDHTDSIYINKGQSGIYDIEY